MTNQKQTYLALDIGEKRIGIAQADSEVRIAFPLCTIEVDGLELNRIREIVSEVGPAALVVGYPRNLSGDPTEQTGLIVQATSKLESLGVPIVYQDESLTSVIAENHLKKTNKTYTKADIDSHAAAIILEDYLDTTHGHQTT